MKVFTLVAAILFLSCSSFAQIEVSKPDGVGTVGTVKNAGKFIAELKYKVIDSDTIFLLLYSNARFERISDIRTLSFSSKDNTLNKFYDILKTFFSDENKNKKDYELTVKLGNDDIILKNYKRLGANAVTILTNDGWFYLSKNQLDKLFGK